MSKISGQLLISGQFQDSCEISGISGQLGALCIGFSKLQLHCQFDARYQKNLTNTHITVFAGLNQVSASLNLMCGRNRFFAGRNPTLDKDQMIQDQDQGQDQERVMPVLRRLETKTKARGQQHCYKPIWPHSTR